MLAHTKQQNGLNTCDGGLLGKAKEWKAERWKPFGLI